ncbi:uncharacterized protein LOC124925883 [Impatiens glandulifera]|uniref:uncharacterized protein LOC124925883 n=1 Tax=Impatiens glandulifera TaxID=253017 RepID=UPI001FB0F21A|nr:uncharacterized protein LOC124925883 [Impatiens glandulifera]
MKLDMAFDPNSVPLDLHQLNIVRPTIMPEETRNTPVTASGRNIEGGGGYYVNTSPVYYSPTISDPGFVGLGYGLQQYPRIPSIVPANGCSRNATSEDDCGGGGGGGGEDSVSFSGRKVKFLCSFGGKVLPRPSDGMLRYVGGQTRIVSVRRDVNLSELIQKMADTYGQSSVVVKYQLPDEDLDALVSVSCPDDLENMMDEYEKLVEKSIDGSAKLRVFLFSPSDLDLAGMVHFGELQDNSGHKYVEAVNGISVISRKESSLATVSSTQHSDMCATEVSPAIPPVSLESAPRIALPTQQQVVNFQPSPTYLQAYPDLHTSYVQIAPKCFQTQILGNVAQYNENLASAPAPASVAQYMTMSPACFSAKPNMVQSFLPPKHYPDQGFNAYPSNVPATVELPTVVAPQGWVPERIPSFKNNCYMCEKVLPHAHSEPLGHGCKESPTNVGPVYHTVQSEDVMWGHVKNKPLAVSAASPHGEGLIDQPRGFGLTDREFKPLLGEAGQFPYGAAVSGTAKPDYLIYRPVNSDIRQTEDPLFPKEEDITETYNAIRELGGRMENIRVCPSEVTVNKDEQKLSPESFLQSSTTSEIFWNNFYQPESTKQQTPQDTVPGLYQQSNLEQDSNHNTKFSPLVEQTMDPLEQFKGADGDTSSNSLFSNQDPWNMCYDTHFPPPKPSNVVYIRNEQGSAGEQQIKQELQAVAEGVAASVLQASTIIHRNPSNLDITSQGAVDLLIDPYQDEKVHNSGLVEIHHKGNSEEKKEKLAERVNCGFPVSDGIGRLQIIKNSDLEELKELGSGTFGTVYHGKWRGTDVAIKRINERCFAGKASEEQRMRDDFWNEAIKLADLHHPNVVAFYGVVLDGPGGSVATVTEYMVNGSLRNALPKNEKTLDRRKRLLIAMDVAFGMEYLHGKNIVHFDLKSDNLLVNLRDPYRPICKVGDLGLSKVKCQTLISGGVRGTLPWMAPELMNGSSNLVSEKVDVFSFAIVMWELLTGEEPYADLHYGAIIGGILSNTLRPAVPESCDLEWRWLMERCWSAEPSERPSFTDIANELRSMNPKGANPAKPQNQAPLL